MLRSAARFSAVLLLAAGMAPVRAQDQKSADLDVRKPPLDDNGRFYVYHNFKQDKVQFYYVPYGWMPAESAEMLGKDGVNLECTTDPYQDPSPQAKTPASDIPETCIAVTVQRWVSPNWCGIAFISGPSGTLDSKTGESAPNDTPWWGKDNRGWYYDLRPLKKKHLVFYARGETGQERIQVKVGILGDQKFGDSLGFPAKTDVLTLPKTWKRFDLDLSDLKPASLQRICNGFTVVMSKDQQKGSGKDGIKFYLDEIYFE